MSTSACCRTLPILAQVVEPEVGDVLKHISVSRPRGGDQGATLWPSSTGHPACSVRGSPRPPASRLSQNSAAPAAGGCREGATAALQLTTCLGGHGEVEQREDGGAPGPHRAEVQQHGGQPVSVVGPGTSLALRPGSGQASALNTSYNLSVDRVEVVHMWLIVTSDAIRDDLRTRN